MRDLLRIHDRIENLDLDVPESVELLRDWNDSLHRIETELKAMHQKTILIEGVSRLIASIFKRGADDAEKVYPTKKH